MFKLLVALLVLAFVSLVEARDPKQRAAFMKLHPCPAGVDKGSTKRCRNYIVDHKKALACGGADSPANMQWQTLAAAKAKDKIELKGCR
jgi:hypothetical protein